MRSPVWITKDKRQVRIDEMDDNHLKNTIAMLRRQGCCTLEELDCLFAAPLSEMGDMASYAVEQEQASARPSKALSYLVEEAEKRGLECR